MWVREGRDCVHFPLSSAHELGPSGAPVAPGPPPRVHPQPRPQSGLGVQLLCRPSGLSLPLTLPQRPPQPSLPSVRWPARLGQGDSSCCAPPGPLAGLFILGASTHASNPCCSLGPLALSPGQASRALVWSLGLLPSC